MRYITLFSLILFTFLMYGQDYEIVTPDQVDRYFPEQIDFYIDKVETEISDFRNQISLMDTKIDSINGLKKRNKKKQKMIVPIEAQKQKLITKVTMLNEIQAQWLALESLYAESRSEEFAEQVEEGVCYSIQMTNGEQLMWYGSPIDVGNEISWNISIPVFEEKKVLRKIQEASTRWEKKKADKNCLSADPDDCLVWCLIEVPPVFETITETVENEKPDGFILSSDSESYIKTVSLSGKSNRKWYIKADWFNSEILISSWERSEC